MELKFLDIKTINDIRRSDKDIACDDPEKYWINNVISQRYEWELCYEDSFMSQKMHDIDNWIASKDETGIVYVYYAMVIIQDGIIEPVKSRFGGIGHEVVQQEIRKGHWFLYFPTKELAVEFKLWLT